MRQPRNRQPEKRNWNKLASQGTLGALGFLMLFQYQNCAPAGGVNSMARLDDSSLVTTIDNVNGTTGVAFTQSKVQLATTDQPTVIDGACDMKQNGAVLGWKVHDSIGTEMERGYAVCEEGKFQVEMAPASQLECDLPYEVTARLNAGTSGHVEIRRDCAGEAAAKISASN